MGPECNLGFLTSTAISTQARDCQVLASHLSGRRKNGERLTQATLILSDTSTATNKINTDDKLQWQRSDLSSGRQNWSQVAIKDLVRRLCNEWELALSFELNQTQGYQQPESEQNLPTVTLWSQDLPL